LDRQALVHCGTFIAFVLGFPFGVGAGPGMFRDGDVTWHVASGNWIISHSRIPTVDPFSFSAAGHPWVATEWLAEIIYASAFNLAGYSGLATVVAAAIIALNAIIFFYLERRVSALALIATLATMMVVLTPFVLARPHVLVFPLLAGWTVLLLKYAEKGRPPPLWSVLILVAWTNLHASFPLAAPIGGAIALDSLNATKWRTLRQWLLFGGACLFAVLANANGVAGWVQPFHISGLNMLSLINEWNPTTVDNTPQFFVVLFAGVGVLLWMGVRVPIGRLLLLLGALAMAFVHVRHQGSFIILAACIVPPLLKSKPISKPAPKFLLLGVLPLLSLRAFVPLTPPETQANPRHLLAAVPPELRHEPVFNGYTFGGPLILAGIRPYIDGRAELYGDDFVLDYSKIAHGDINRFNRAVERYGIRWTMLPKGDDRLVQALDASPEWRRIYEDNIGVIHVRTSMPMPRSAPAETLEGGSGKIPVPRPEAEPR
jgi:hypothetical protein